MSKEKRIIDIKSVQDFYKALRDEVANLFNSYERCGIFDGWNEQQKKECFGFGTHILSIIYNPIQKRYTKQERKKYEKIIDDYEKNCKEKNRQIADLQSQLAESKKEKEFFKEESKINKKDADYYFDEYILYKHKLAEKKKEIEELKLDNEKYFTESCRANKEIAYKLKQQNQKAIEQLEKVKEEFGYKYNSQLVISSKQLVKFIDQQITLLK